jgi:hypothetical protein
LLGDEWQTPAAPSRARVLAIASLIGISLIVTCIVVLRTREHLWEPEIDSSWVTRVSGTLNHDQPASEVIEPPPPPPAPAPLRRSTATFVGRPTLPAGFLSINSSPWAELSVDGRVVGTTPQVRIRVTPGKHHLLLAREGFQTHSAWVTVRAGGTVRLTDITLVEIAR